MRKILLGIGILGLMANPCFAVHNLIFKDAGELTSGVLDPARVSPTTFTLRGTQWSVDLDRSTSSIILNQGNTNYATSLSTSLLLLNGGNTNYAPATYTSTSDAKSNSQFTATFSSLTTLSNSTSTLGVPQVWSDEGTALTGGAVRRVDCVGANIACAQSNSTVTVTITGGGGGASVREFTIVVGTLGAISGTVDIASNNTNGLHEALRQCGSMGLITPSSVTCSVFYRSGLYTITDTTIPAGVRVWAVPKSSTVWALGANSIGFVTVYGEVDGIDFDWAGVAYAGKGITISSAGRVTNFESRGSQAMETTSQTTSLFRITNTTGAYVQGTFKNIKAPSLANSGSRTDAPITVENSKNTVITIKTVSVDYSVGGAAGVIFIAKSSNTFFQDCEFYDAGGVFMNIEGGNDTVGVTRSKFFISAGAIPTQGIIELYTSINSPALYGVSTMTVIADNYFDTKLAGAMIGIDNNTNATKFSETWIKNNVVRNRSGGTVTFASLINAGSNGTVLTGNKVDAATTFISDSGVATTYLSQGNFVGQKEQ